MASQQAGDGECRQQSRDKRCAAQDLQTGRAGPFDELCTPITPHVLGEFVCVAPKPGMLGHGRHQNAAWPQRTRDCPKCAGIVSDVLEHVERADGVESGFLPDPCRVTAAQLHAVEALPSYLQPYLERLQSHAAGGGIRGVHRTEHKASSAPDLEVFPELPSVAT